MDEPTTGLHFRDVELLVAQLKRLVTQGATIVVIEHNIDVIMAADWMIDLGPGAASAGGRLLYAGSPASLPKDYQSPTAHYL